MESPKEENGKELSTDGVNGLAKECNPEEIPNVPNIDDALDKELNSTATLPVTKVINNSEMKNEARNKRLDRSRKKNEKNHELFLKSIQSLPLQDQIDILVKKLNDSMNENITSNNTVKLYKNQMMILEKEKEQLRTEHNKTLMARTRLENVCRELQNNYKQIKEETAQKIRDEEEKRKEVTTKFQATLADVSKMMEQNSNENIKLRNDNIQLSERFKKLCEEFKAREEDVQNISKQLGLEKKLSEANLARCQLELEAERCEKEVWLKEKEVLLRKMHDTTKNKLTMEISMKNMEENLSRYSDKYQKFESTITKSNEIFEMYKSELSSMSKQVTKLEADCLAWKERWVQTSQAVNRLIGVNQSLENDLMLSDKKLDQLASLCRFLQNERNCYLKQLKENNIKPEVTSIPEEKTDASDSKGAKEKATPMTAKERELAALRSEIIKLQSEINKTVEKEMEEKRKLAKQQEIDKTKRRTKNKKSKKNSKGGVQEPVLSKSNSIDEKQENSETNSPSVVDESPVEVSSEERVSTDAVGVNELPQEPLSDNNKTDSNTNETCSESVQTCSVSNNDNSCVSVSEENGATINT